ncbi:bacteriocin [Nostoc sp.]|uniref:bacteriocin n=1 Tax=Nostoc sp. TaxID=1180 RepID=UPI002FF88E1E
MNIIKLENLSNAGYLLFEDSETFLNELTEDELSCVKGGFIDIGILSLAFIEGIFNNLAIPVEQNVRSINGQSFNAYTQNNINTSP